MKHFIHDVRLDRSNCNYTDVRSGWRITFNLVRFDLVTQSDFFFVQRTDDSDDHTNRLLKESERDQATSDHLFFFFSNKRARYRTKGSRANLLRFASDRTKVDSMNASKHLKPEIESVQESSFCASNSNYVWFQLIKPTNLNNYCFR